MRARRRRRRREPPMLRPARRRQVRATDARPRTKRRRRQPRRRSRARSRTLRRGRQRIRRRGRRVARIRGRVAAPGRLPLITRATRPGERRTRAGAVAPLPRVLLHRLVDEVIDAAFELARHLLERLPEHVSALEAASAFLVRVRAHLLFISGGPLKDRPCLLLPNQNYLHRPKMHSRCSATLRLPVAALTCSPSSTGRRSTSRSRRP